MNGRNGPPLSPVSVGGGGGVGSEWSPGPGSISRYQSVDDGRYDPSNPLSRNLPVSPPISGGPVGLMNGFARNGGGGPSPPPSVGGSSNGTGVAYARSEGGGGTRMSASGRDPREIEAVLAEHYLLIETFLRETSLDPKASQQPNKAQDKLLRLSSTQFLELSTDVYDELVRRRALAQRRPPSQTASPPPFLPAEPNFHPKRNQARQKLSSLGPPRFRELASDVFSELDRRFPRFAAGDMPRSTSRASGRPGSRSQTPIGGGAPGGGIPPRSQSRMRKMSDASSLRGPAPLDSYGLPSSPGLAPNGFGQQQLLPQQPPPLQPRSFQSNTIVPNKSTMVEEDDEEDSADTGIGTAEEDVDDDDINGAGFGDRNRRGVSKASRMTGLSGAGSDTDRKLMEDYQSQTRDLREKLDNMEDLIKRKDDEINSLLDRDRDRSGAEKREWADQRARLERQLSDVQDANGQLRQQIDRQRDEAAAAARRLQDQLDAALQEQSRNSGGGAANSDPELKRENEELRQSLREQQKVTEEVRQEAQTFLREMRILSEQSGSTWERQAELERTIDQLEQEVRDWRGRYARTKTQLRNLRASSMGLPIDQDAAARYVREPGFTEDDGVVKDMHVTKFQIAVDELLHKARREDPERAMDAMKMVVAAVRRITKDVDEAAAAAGDEQQQQQQQEQRARLKAKVSTTANSLITASKNFASSAGISPVSLLDAAAGHLVAAVVELLRTVKIRPTPAGELEEDDDSAMTPVAEAPPPLTLPLQQQRRQQQPLPQPQLPPLQLQRDANASANNALNSFPQPPSAPLPPPPPFQGLSGLRNSTVSSAYSPVNSPRQSASNGQHQYAPTSTPRRPTNGSGRMPPPAAANTPVAANSPAAAEELKVYLEDQTAQLVSDIQGLVGSIRADADIDRLEAEIRAIVDIVGSVIIETQAGGLGDMSVRLGECRQRLVEAGERGAALAAKGLGPAERDWRMWTATLPPIAFEIVRETKALVQRVDQLVMGGAGGDADDDFA